MRLDQIRAELDRGREGVHRVARPPLGEQHRPHERRRGWARRRVAPELAGELGGLGEPAVLRVQAGEIELRVGAGRIRPERGLQLQRRLLALAAPQEPARQQRARGHVGRVGPDRGLQMVERLVGLALPQPDSRQQVVRFRVARHPLEDLRELPLGGRDGALGQEGPGQRLTAVDVARLRADHGLKALDPPAPDTLVHRLIGEDGQLDTGGLEPRLQLDGATVGRLGLRYASAHRVHSGQLVVRRRSGGRAPHCLAQIADGRLALARRGIGAAPRQVGGRQTGLASQQLAHARDRLGVTALRDVQIAHRQRERALARVRLERPLQHRDRLIVLARGAIEPGQPRDRGRLGR